MIVAKQDLVPVLLQFIVENKLLTTQMQYDLLSEMDSPERIFGIILVISPDWERLFDLLLKHPREDMRALPLGIDYPPLPLYVLKKLVRDPSDAVRECVATSAHTPASLLQILAKDPVSFVQEAALKYLSSPTPPT